MKRRTFLAGLSVAGIGLPMYSFASRGPGGQASAAARAAKGAAARSGGEGATAGVTKAIADFVVNTGYEHLPADLIALGKKSILDALGLSLAGSVRSPIGKIGHDYLRSLGYGNAPSATNNASVFGSHLRVPPRFAAFANGMAIHADDFDDTQLSSDPTRVYGLLTHPTVTALPSALAVAEAENRSGRDFMLAYHLAVEVETKIAEAIDPRHYEDGFHSTGTCGVFGAAAAAAKLRGLDVEHVREAFGLAGAQSSGLRENFGTMTKPFQAGHAAEGGVASADLVALGWTAADNILEAKRGFFHAAGGGFDPAPLERIGQPWTMVKPGVSIKPFPSGSLTHPGMTLMQQLIRANHLKASDIEKVRVGASKHMINTLLYHRPKTGLEGKFSMEFCMAILLVNGGTASLADFQDAVVMRPEVQAMIGKVDFYDSAEADRIGLDKMHTVIDVTLKNGRTLSGKIDYGKGSPQSPMSFDDVVEKFMGSARYAGWSTGTAKKLVDAVKNLESLEHVSTLTAWMRPAS